MHVRLEGHIYVCVCVCVCVCVFVCVCKTEPAKPCWTTDVTGTDSDSSPLRTSLRPVIYEGTDPAKCNSFDPKLVKFLKELGMIHFIKRLRNSSRLRSVWF